MPRVFSKSNPICSRDYLTIAFRTTRGHVVSSLPNARLVQLSCDIPRKVRVSPAVVHILARQWNPSCSVSEGSRRARFPFTRARAYALSSGTRSGPASAYLRHLANTRASVRACTREGQPGGAGLAWVSIKIITADTTVEHF